MVSKLKKKPIKSYVLQYNKNLQAMVLEIFDTNGMNNIIHLIRTYFKLDGHHIQFNVVSADTLRAAQKNPEKYRDLIVRVAGYSDYFNNLGPKLQEEIIKRTEHHTE